jgi:hypothetical protein
LGELSGNGFDKFSYHDRLKYRKITQIVSHI